MRRVSGLTVLLLSVLLTLGFVPARAAEEFVIAKGDQAAAPLVLLPNSGKMAEEAMRDLRRVLGVMCGKVPEMGGDATKEPALVVGLASEWAKLTKDEGPSARLAPAAAESFLLLSTPTRLLILGKDPRGVSHGVYTLLHDLGCRWYFLTKDWEIIPKKATVSVQVDRVEGPAMRMRKLNCGASQGGSSRALFEDWSRRNRMGSAYGRAGINHAYAGYVPESLYKEHPEYFAWVSPDGDAAGASQNGLQPCTTRPEVVKLFAEGAQSLLRSRKERDPNNVLLLSVSPNDNTGNLCRCERCRAVGSYTDCALLLANQVAEAIQGEFPSTLVGFMAYGRVSPAPSPGRTANSNVIVSMATAYTWNSSPLEMMVEWPKFVRHLIIREYYCIGQWGGARPDYQGPNLADISRTLKRWHARGIEGMESEMAHHWGSCGHRFWAASKLLWNPSLPAESVENDFYENCWAEAAAPMRRYYERWESGQPASPRTLGLAFQDLTEAARLAKSPEVLQRVNLMTLYLHWFHLQEETKKIADECRRLKLSEDETQQRVEKFSEEGNHLLYRWKEAYLLSIQPRAYSMTRPSTPYSPAEVDAIRKEDLAFYQKASGGLLEMGGGSFSADLVPLRDFKNLKALESCESIEGNFGKTSYLVRAKENEELAMFLEKPRSATDREAGAKAVKAPEPRAPAETKPAAVAEGNDAPEETPVSPSRKKMLGRLVIWSLGKDGREREFVALHKFPADSSSVPFKFKAPQEGLYLVNVSSSARDKPVGFRIENRPAMVMVADMKNQRDVYPLEVRPREEAPLAKGKHEARGAKPASLFYFYVPAGTQRFALQLLRLKSAPLDFKMTTVSGQTVREETATHETEWVIPVPPDKAGSIWRLWVNTDRLSRLGLDGIPPYVATHPRNLLIPREGTGTSLKP